MISSLRHEGPIQRERLHYLDWLRVLSVLGVFYAHTTDIFDRFYWHVRGGDQQAGLMVLVIFGTEWGMALFFFLAGTSAWFALRSRTPGQFIGERFKRLIIPCIVGVILFSPPQAYLLAISHGLYHGSLFQFYPFFFENIHPNWWNPQWIGTYSFHLWFLADLFFIALVALPVLLLLKRKQGLHFISRLVAVCTKPGGLFVFGIPIALVQVALRGPFPGYQSWSDVFTWLLIFIYGFMLLADPRFELALQKQWKLILAVSIASLLVMLGASFIGALTSWDALSDYSAGYVLYQLLRSIVIWSWMLFALYFGLCVLDFSNKVIDYANEAILPFYVLHHPVIVVTAFFTFTWGLALGIKYLVVSTVALLATLALYELCVRRISVMRWLFGMKSLHKSRPEPSPGSGPISSASTLNRPLTDVSSSGDSERKGFTMLLHPPKKFFAKMPSDYGLSYRDVRFPGREDQLMLAGWFIPGVLPDGQLTAERAIMVVHGLDSSREAPEAGLLDLSVELVKHGFAVLAFDTRGHGESAPARPSMGYFEQNDVLGAVDFLRSGPLPFPALGRPRAIGGYGISMGGAALLLATAREPAIQAAVTDCAFAAFVPLIAQATRLPHMFMPVIANVMGLLFGINYHAIRPVDVVASIAPRPLFLIHAGADKVVPPVDMLQLAAAASAGADAHVQTWLIDGAEHIQSYHTMGAEYTRRVVAFFIAALGPAGRTVATAEG